MGSSHQNEPSAPLLAPGGDGPRHRDRRGLWIAAGIFAFALAVRLAYVYDSSGNPTFRLPVIDSLSYHQAARELAQGHGFTYRFFFQPFLYPFFLAGVYLFSGTSIVAAKIVQSVLGAVTCVLTYALGTKVFGRRVGIASALITAVYGPLVFFEAELDAAGLAAFWMVALVLLALQAARRKSPPWMFLYGLCGALAILTRPTFAPFVGAAGLYLAAAVWRGKRSWRSLALSGAMFLAGFALPALPVAYANARTTGHFGFMPSFGGLNFYIGNNPNSDETINIRPGMRWLDLIELPARHGVRGDMWDSQRGYWQLVRQYVASQPLSFVKGLLWKTEHFLSSRETPRNVDIYLFRQWSPMLSAMVWKAGPFGFPFGALLPLAAVGAVFCFRRAGPILLLQVALYSASIILVFVSDRYRVPIMPLMAILAAGGAAAVIQAARRRRWASLAAAGAVLAAAAVLTTVPGPFASERISYGPELHFLLCDSLDDAGQKEQALDQLRQAIAMKSDFADAHAELGFLLEKQGKLPQAEEHYRAALRIDPGLVRVRINLGNVLSFRDDVPGAEREYRQAIAQRPDVELAHKNLALMLDRQGRLDEAIQEARAAVQIDDRYGEGHTTLAWLLRKRGRLPDAVFHYRRALELAPSETAHADLGDACLDAGLYGQAAEQYAEALKSLPNNAALHQAMARALAGMGRHEQAEEEIRQAARLRGETSSQP